MGENTAIAWCDHTFNPWWGCSKVSPACDHCYAETWAKRVGFPDLWSGVFRTFGEKHWREPVKWNAAAEAAGVRGRVFCASMADVFDKNAPESERERLWTLIRETPRLDWLLLTKRIGNVSRMLPLDQSGRIAANVWLGISVVTQAEADRDIPKLLELPARIRFLSCEPLIEPIDLKFHIYSEPTGHFRNGPKGKRQIELKRPDDGGLHWVIVGGESGAKARPMLSGWAEALRKQCTTSGVSFFMKQGSQNNWGPDFSDIDFFPPALRVREWPDPSSVTNVGALS